jgi:hypothetical protein
MSTYQQRLVAAAEKRLSVLLQDTANLNLQFSELNRLRDRVGQAEGRVRNAGSGPRLNPVNIIRKSNAQAKRQRSVNHQLTVPADPHHDL